MKGPRSVYHSSTEGHLGYYQQSCEEASCASLCFGAHFLFSLVRGSGTAGSHGRYTDLWDTAKLLSDATRPGPIPATWVWEPPLLRPPHHRLVLWPVRWTGISLTCWDLFMRVFAKHLHSLVRHLSKSFDTFLIGYLFSYHCVLRVLYVL